MKRKRLHPKIYRYTPILSAVGPQVETIAIATRSGRGTRVEKLPPYDECNPKHVHVARRRQVTQDHKSFPRGWKWKLGNKNATVEGLVTI